MQPSLGATLRRTQPSALTREGGENGFLHVQTILGFIKDHAPRVVPHRLRDLIPRMRGQAMHDQCIGLGGGK